MREVSGPRVISARVWQPLDISLNSLTFEKMMPAIDRLSDLEGISLISIMLHIAIDSN